jgi:hypothetical protein
MQLRIVDACALIVHLGLQFASRFRGVARDGLATSGTGNALALGRFPCRQELILGEITQFGLSLLKARSTNPPVGPDLAEFPDRPMAAGAAESLFYLADHI